MDNMNDISKNAFEPCHIEEVVSPFSVCEQRSLSHNNRFCSPLLKSDQDGSTPDDKKD